VIRRLALLFSCAVSTACATAPEAKLDAREAFGAAKPGASARKPAAQKQVDPKHSDGAQMSDELSVALTRFATSARLERSRVQKGDAMPSGAVSNWLRFNSAVDDFLSRPVAKTSSFDIVRARVTAEAELELDARAYGNVPAQLAENVLDRVNMLATRMAAVRRMHVVTARKKTMFIWPVEPTVVTSLFGRRLHPVAGTWKQHFGIDLAADEGQLVSAAAEGVVLRAGFNGAHGLQVEVQHNNGVVTRYSHLSQSLVEPGLTVKRGDVLGLAGNTGVTTGAHLHFEIWRQGNPCDPLEELGRPMAETDSMAAL
jgi:murein DD-endopeptidase MepM/ murein hydrolase activator NlpD